jgi:hypothetical protein
MLQTNWKFHQVRWEIQKLCKTISVTMKIWEIWREWVHLVLRPLFWPIVPAPDDDDDCGAISGMRIGRGNWSTQRKPAPVPLCPSQTPHDLTQARTQATTVGRQWLTTWAMAWPTEKYGIIKINTKETCQFLSTIGDLAEPNSLMGDQSGKNKTPFKWVYCHKNTCQIYKFRNLIVIKPILHNIYITLYCIYLTFIFIQKWRADLQLQMKKNV